MAVLVTGGAGYIGSHTCLVLLNAGFEVVVLDNFVNSSPVALQRVQELTGKSLTLVQGDMCDSNLLASLFAAHRIESVIHFAGLKAVGESVRLPLQYYRNNLVGTLALLQAMADASVNDLIFSSSATVYGIPEQVPIPEQARLATTNPYGATKLMIENILGDLSRGDAGANWRIAMLRYFNPVGAHVSGRIGEDPRGIPNNLVPYISRVAVGALPELSIYGQDYPTHDGTGVRDYIHVMDLAEAHVKTLQWLQGRKRGLCEAFNLGTGQGYSVFDVIRAYEQASGKTIPYRIVARREGDVAACYSDPAKAKVVLGWQASRDLPQMMADAWRWQQCNPHGFAG